MGSPASEANHDRDEVQVNVTLSRGFWLGQSEVTQEQWRGVMGTSPWTGKSYQTTSDNYPAVYVNWHDVTEFCRELTARERSAKRLPSGWIYQLPTEAQWEYACRAETTRPYNGDGRGTLSDYAWYDWNTHKVGEEYAHQVGQKKPNRWGLHDMHGNVFEWCRDWYGQRLPGGRNPLATTAGSLRVFRGGSWATSAESCRSAYRFGRDPSDRHGAIGFRLALSQSGE